MAKVHTVEPDLVPMRRRHLRAVMAIERLVYPRPWTAQVFRDELGQRNRSYVVAELDGSVVGYSGTMLIEEDAHVTTISVNPVMQRRGIGTVLLLELARTARRRGARHMTLEVRAGNAAAQGLYRRFGFAPVGVRRNYYPETGEDALVMWARDIDTPSYVDRLALIESSASRSGGRSAS